MSQEYKTVDEVLKAVFLSGYESEPCYETVQAAKANLLNLIIELIPDQPDEFGYEYAKESIMKLFEGDQK